MAKVILSLNGVSQKERELNKERITIGRKPTSDIPIDNLAVSGKHAVIITILDDSFIEDLGSTNGTLVNGKAIKKRALKNNDTIAVGKHELKFINETDADDDDDFEKTVIVKPSSASASIAAARAAEKAGAGAVSANALGNKSSSMPLGRLTILNGPMAGKDLELNKALITIGKPGTQVAVISRRPQGYFLTHINSDGDGKRYPVVNNNPIGPRAYKLKDTDLIELAGIKMEFSA